MKRWPGIFRTLPQGLIQSYSDIFRTLCNACIRRNLGYSESRNIQNPSIIAFRQMFRALSYPLTCGVTSHYVFYDTYLEPCLLLKTQTYSGIFTSYLDIFSHIVAYLDPCVTLAYYKPCHIQNPDIFKTQDISSTLSRHILAYSQCCVTLAYWEP